jgi:hypothetical protein
VSSNGFISVSRSFTVFVNPALALPTAFTIHRTYSQAISTSVAGTGGSSPLSYSMTGAPPGVQIGSSTGLITGTANDAGTFSLAVTVTDSNSATASQTYPLVVAPLLSITNSSLANGSVGTTYSATLTTSGGRSPITFAVSSGSLPAGVALNGGTLSGTPTAAGSSTFVISATDANGAVAVRPLSITVSLVPSITTSSLSQATRLRPYSATIGASGGTGSGYAFSVTGGSLPAGMALASNGTISGTPTSAGIFNFTVQVADSNNNTATSSLSLQVNNIVSVAPAGAITNTTVGRPVSATINATGGTAPITWSSTGSLPAGLTFSNGTVSGTPTAAGAWSITITATDANGSSASVNLGQTVNPLPTLNFESSPISVGAAISRSISVTGGTSPYTFTIQSGGAPAGMTLSSAGVLSGTATALGLAQFGVQVTDAAGATGTGTFTWQVVAAPSVQIPSLGTGTVGAPKSVQVSATGGIGAVTFALGSGSLPPGMSLSSSGLLSGTPTAAGTYSFAIQVTDSLGSVSTSAPLSLSVFAPLTISPGGTPTVTVGRPVQIQSTVSGGATPYTYSVTGTVPPGLAFNSTTGAVTGTASSAGSFAFTVTATDANGASVSTSYSQTINPVMSGNGLSLGGPLTVGGSVNIPLAVTGGTAPIVWSIVSGSLPLGMFLNGATLGGTPTVAGSFPITLRATDASGATLDVSHTIIVNSGVRFNEGQTLSPATVGVGYSFAFSASSATETATITFGSGSLPPGMTFANGAISGTPTAPGVFSFELVARDSQGSSAGQHFSLTVNPALSISGSLGSILRGTAITNPLVVTGGTPPLSFQILNGNVPTGLSFDSSTGAITGTPTQVGPYSFTIGVRDRNQASAQVTFSGVVSDPLVITTIGQPSILGMGQPISVTFNATGGTAPFQWSLEGQAPAGLMLAGNVLSGTPTTSGNFSFSVRVRDAGGLTATQSFSLAVVGGVVAQPSALQFSTITGTPTSPRQRVQFHTDPGGIPVQVSANSAWLRTNTDSTLTPGTLEVWVDSTQLTPGTYAGQVTIMAGTTTTIEVGLEVRTPDVQTLEADLITNLPEGYQLVLRTPASRLPYIVRLEGSGAGGFSIDQPVGEVRSGQATVLQIRPVSPLKDPSETLEPLTEVVVINDADLTESRFELPGFNAPRLRVSADRMRFTANDVAANRMRDLNLRAIGERAAYATIKNADWITISPAEGTLAPASVAKVGVDPAGLAPGTYNGEIEVYDQTGRVASRLAVEMEVPETPREIERRPTLSTNAVVALNANTPVTVRVRNHSRRVVSFTTGSDSVRVTPAAGRIPAGGEVEVSVQATRAQDRVVFAYSEGGLDLLEVGLASSAPNCAAAAPTVRAMEPGEAFEAVVQVTRTIRALVTNACGANLERGTLTVVPEDGPAVPMLLGPNGVWFGAWTPMAPGASKKLEFVWMDAPDRENRQTVVRQVVHGAVRP